MSSSIIVGIDPGLSGAIAFLSPVGELLAVEDMPTDTVRVGATHRPRIAYSRLLAVLNVPGARAFLEIPTGRPITFRDKQSGARQVRNPGAAGMLALGETVGAARCACAAHDIGVTDVTPGAWMRAMGVDAVKDTSRHRVAQLFPAMAALFARKRDHDRAQSVLIGLYGLQRTGVVTNGE